MTLVGLDFAKVNANATVKAALVTNIKQAFLANMTGYTKDDSITIIGWGWVVAGGGRGGGGGVGGGGWREEAGGGEEEEEGGRWCGNEPLAVWDLLRGICR